MSQILKRIVVAQKPAVLIEDLKVFLRNKNDSIDLLAPDIKGRSIRSIEEICSSISLDNLIKNGSLKIYDENGSELSGLSGGSGERSTNLATLKDVDEATGSGGGHVIKDEGVSLPQRTNLNFIGDGVGAVDDPSNNSTNITINSIGGGTSGYSGISGFSGYSGINGSDGTSGFSGYSGTSGYSGISGYSGYSGYSGISGANGSDGSDGASGYSGFSGVSGYSGINGSDGTSGFSGISGFSGYSGISGFSGYSGISGYSGYSGFSGYSGYSGINGSDGTSGYSGFSGVSGYSGYSGYSGISGFSGISGYSGISGFSGAVPWTLNGTDLYPSSTSYNIGIGTTVPENPFEVFDANNSDGTPIIQIRQTGTFDASVRLRVPATSWTFGIDNSDSDIFKIENATALGGVSPAFTLDTSGNAVITGSLAVDGLTLDGNTILANSGTNAQFGFDSSNYFRADNNHLYMRIGNAFRFDITTSAIVPYTSAGMALGTSSNVFSSAYIDEILINGGTISTTSGNLNLSPASNFIAIGGSTAISRGATTLWTSSDAIQNITSLTANTLVEVDSSGSAQFILDKGTSGSISEILFQTAGTNTYSVKMDTDSHLKILRNNGGWVVDGYIDWSNGSFLWGGGYGSTGVTISSAGNLSMDGALTVAGTNPLVSWDSPTNPAWSWQVVDSTNLFRILHSGSSYFSMDVSNIYLQGGYGSTGITIPTNGNLSMNGNLIVDGTASIGGNLTAGDADGDMFTARGQHTIFGSASSGRFVEEYIFSGTVDDSPEVIHTIAPPSGDFVTGIMVLTITGAYDGGGGILRYSYYALYDFQIDDVGTDSISLLGTAIEEDTNNILALDVTEASPGYSIGLTGTIAPGEAITYTVHAKITWTKI